MNAIFTIRVIRFLDGESTPFYVSAFRTVPYFVPETTFVKLKGGRRRRWKVSNCP